MQVEYINAFIEASIKVINEVTGFSPSPGKVAIRNTIYKGNNLLVIIGLVGNITGTVVIYLNKEVAVKVASMMMMGVPVNELDEMAKSAISELCNMILGNTMTILSKKNIEVDITPPTMLAGDNIEITMHKSVIVNIPLIFESDISYKENA
jgi:chemotaxis protein CheX